MNTLYFVISYRINAILRQWVNTFLLYLVKILKLSKKQPKSHALKRPIKKPFPTINPSIPRVMIKDF